MALERCRSLLQGTQADRLDETLECALERELAQSSVYCESGHTGSPNQIRAKTCSWSHRPVARYGNISRYPKYGADDALVARKVARAERS